MGRFRFESLLKLREAARDEKKNAFLEIEDQRRKAFDELAELDAAILCERETSRRSRENVNINEGDLRFAQERRIKLSSKRKQLKAQLDALTRETEKKRQDFNVAVKEVKILQNLKDRTEEREMEEANRRSTKTIDELASQHKTYERRQKEQDEEM